MRPSLLAVVLLLLVPIEALAMIDPAFLGIARIGFLCRVEPDDAAAQAVAEDLCRRATALASARLPNGPQAVALAAFDPRVGDPATLLVTLHGNRAVEGLVLAVGLHRQGTPPGSLFPAAPQVVPAADSAALDRALLALIERPVLAPFTPAVPGGPLR
jgi:hypothetical protein